MIVKMKTIMIVSNKFSINDHSNNDNYNDNNYNNNIDSINNYNKCDNTGKDI